MTRLLYLHGSIVLSETIKALAIAVSMLAIVLCLVGAGVVG